MVMARTPAYWTINKKCRPSLEAVSQLSLSQARHGFGAPYCGSPAFAAPSNCLKTAKPRRLLHLGLVLLAHLNSINKRNPTAFAIAEVTESELEDDNLGLKQFLDSEFDGVDGGHEANAVLHSPEGTAEIRSSREGGVRKRNFDDMVYYYRRLHLPVNAPAQNMFLRDVKRLSFRCQTLKFPRPNVKFYFSTLLKGKMFLINKKGKNYQKGVPLSTICRINWKNLRRIILSQKLLNRTSSLWVTRSKTSHLGGKTSKFDTWNSDVWRHFKTCFTGVRSRVDATDGKKSNPDQQRH